MYTGFHNVVRNLEEKKGFKLDYRPLPIVYARYRAYKKALRIPPVIRRKIVEDYLKGVSEKEIREKYGFPNDKFLLYTILAIENVRQRRLKKKKVTPIEEKQIIEMYKQGMPMLQIAKTLGRPVSTIYYVLKRRGLK